MVALTESCVACGTSVTMCFHVTTGKRAPIDTEPSEDGNVQRVGEDRYRIITAKAPADPDAPRFKSHFATCTDAARFRRKT